MPAQTLCLAPMLSPVPGEGGWVVVSMPNDSVTAFCTGPVTSSSQRPIPGLCVSCIPPARLRAPCGRGCFARIHPSSHWARCTRVLAHAQFLQRLKASGKVLGSGSWGCRGGNLSGEGRVAGRRLSPPQICQLVWIPAST